ncbi:MAG TPA: hypothetical protein VFZ34_25735 [Blastocatellia bacterium]|nr:hypothetical protein [Blastocatellia bacterium]
MTFSAWVICILLLISFVCLPAGELHAQIVPAPPVQQSDRLGVYNWGVDYMAYPGGTVDRLNWAAEKVAALGSRTIRVAMPGDFYLVNTPGMTDLAQIAASPAYDKLFSDPRFQTYLLTAYSASDMQSQWCDGFTPDEATATRAEFTRFGEYLLSQSRWAGKTFIILNWEGDNALEAFANKPSIWDAYTAWIQARADGIRAARQRYPGSAVKLFSGLEFNLVRNKQSGVACGTPNTDRLQQEPLKNRCVIDYVAPRVEVDYYSYSAWQTVLGAAVQGVRLKDALQQDLNFALTHVRTRRPAVQEHNFLLGEFGFQRMHWGENAVANLVNEMFDALAAPDAFPVSYAIFWQIIDNAPNYLGADDGFGLYRSRYGRFDLTRAGEVFQKRLAGQVVESLTPRPLIRIPTHEIRRAGDITQTIAALVHHKQHFLLSGPVVATIPVAPYDAVAETEKQISIEAVHSSAAFSPRDNAVRMEQGTRQLSLPRDFGVSFLESEMQITVGLPTTLHHGIALLYVTDRDGVESNAQRLKLTCPSCPAITTAEDMRGIGESSPGSVVTINGSGFSATGNTVVIEQQTTQGKSQRFVVTPDEAWREATNRITFRLPATLLPQKLALVTVLTNQLLESNEFVMWIARDCAACAPALRVPQAMMNRVTNRDQFYPGAPITIRGERFSAAGNQVIIEQGTQRFIVAAGKGWSESTTQILAELPLTLSPGYARFYVVDVQGRESRAQSLLITHAPTRRQSGSR